MNTLAIAVASIALSVAAQFLFKAGISGPASRALLAQPLTVETALGVVTNSFVLGGFLLYALGALAWLGVLARWDVSKAYPVVGLGFVLALAIGTFAGEQIGPARVIGVTLICIGVGIVART